MFDLVKPPTDSLYKFLAIAGLAILLAAGWRYSQLEIEIYKRRVELAKLEEVPSILFNRLYKNAENTIRRELKEGKIDEKEKEARLETLFQTVVDVFATEYVQSTYDKELESRKKLEEAEAVEPERTLLRYATVFGFVLMMVGLITWYFIIQSPADQAQRINNAIQKLNLQELHRKAKVFYDIPA